MNKIKIVNDQVIEQNIKKGISIDTIVKNDDFCVNKISINITKSLDILIDYEFKEVTKLDLYLNISDNIIVNIYEIKSGHDVKMHTTYTLGNNSNLNIIKFCDCEKVREAIDIKLDGEYAKATYKYRTISEGYEKYDMVIYHSNKNTNSLIDNKGVNVKDGTIIFNVTGIIPNGCINSNLCQDNRIVTFNNNKCSINPNLIIDENEVEASHSAHIGKFDYEELFYLMRLGISEELATKLLIKGLLISGIDITKIEKDKINHMIDKCRR